MCAGVATLGPAPFPPRQRPGGPPRHTHARARRQLPPEAASGRERSLPSPAHGPRRLRCRRRRQPKRHMQLARPRPHRSPTRRPEARTLARDNRPLSRDPGAAARRMSREARRGAGTGRGPWVGGRGEEGGLRTCALRRGGGERGGAEWRRGGRPVGGARYLLAGTSRRLPGSLRGGAWTGLAQRGLSHR